ncbi:MULTISPECIES: acyl CoA:acetate/3-ketoacid CoA transferase [unclassified Paenibacillus]|uniref:acyl CoA:acetate/3-ketoacid CoA transferase n=1 Tax=unclassified Paenibacillus TaxID=185978 RepID=UPI002118303E|nr:MULTISPECIES: CoA-transferase [unclassified Paenibacillus]
MTRKVKVSTAAEVAASLKDNSTILSTGFSLIGVAEEIYQKIEERFLDSGSPRDLTFVHSAGQSDTKRGMEHLAHVPLLKRIIGSHWGLSPKLEHLIHQNQVEAFCLPMGQILSMYKAAASGKPGVLSRIGLATFVDPRFEGGKMNRKARDSGFEVVQNYTLHGKEYLFYPSLTFDLYIGRGTTADEFGNITMEDECVKLEVMPAVQAVKASGGRVIFQVKRLVKGHSLPPKEVVIPGILVDEVVVCQNPLENHRMTSSDYYNPYLLGTIQEPYSSSHPVTDLDMKKLIGRRAVLEMNAGDTVNLGVGIPGDSIGAIIGEEKLDSQLSLSIEVGSIGGISIGGGDFGVAKNAEAIIDNSYQFDYYNGCGVDITFMGAGEIDREGNVNVSKFGHRSPGCGGFIDITQTAKKVVFCSTFTTGGLVIEVENGLVRIKREGRVKKFVHMVRQITFNGKFATAHRQSVLFVTERAVFQLTDQGMELIEIAPGIDLKKNVLDQMEFAPQVSPNLRLMDERIYSLGLMHLAAQCNKDKDQADQKLGRVLNENVV